jgi:hypothetical protein
MGGSFAVLPGSAVVSVARWYSVTVALGPSRSRPLQALVGTLAWDPRRTAARFLLLMGVR